MKNKLNSILMIIPILFIGCTSIKNNNSEEFVGNYYTKNNNGITSTLLLNQDNTFTFRNKIDSFVWETSGVWSTKSRHVILTSSKQMDSSCFVINKGERNKDTITLILNKGGHYSTNFYVNDRLVRMAGSDNVLIFPRAWGDSVVINELWSSVSIRISLTFFELDTLYVNTYLREGFIKDFKDEKFKYHRKGIKFAKKIRLKKELLP